MEVEYYSEKSIVVYGNTKAFKDQLKELGGKYNPNLRKGPGWIFSKNKENDIIEFVKNNNGNIQTLEQLKLEDINELPRCAAILSQNLEQFSHAQIKAIAMSPQNLNFKGITEPPKPTTMLPSSLIQLNYPNVFTAGDGNNYQIIIYTLPLPSMNQKVTLKVEYADEDVSFVVAAINSPFNKLAPFDDILLTKITENKDEEIARVRAVIINGKWQILHMKNEHDLIFL